MARTKYIGESTIFLCHPDLKGTVDIYHRSGGKGIRVKGSDLKALIDELATPATEKKE